MDPQRYADAIERESRALRDAAVQAGFDAPVPSCPDWTVADLLGHIGQVQTWAAGLVERRATEAAWLRDDPPEVAAQLVPWAEGATRRLLDVLDATPPDTPMWTFVGPGTAAFWFRRQAHEVALHRVDAELAAGRVSPIDADLARDGIDEFLDMVVGGRLRERFTGTGETIHLHCTDVDRAGDGEWLVRLGADGPEIERAHAKGDVAVRGTASDLLLVMRNRGSRDAVEIFGDAAVLDRFCDLARV